MIRGLKLNPSEVEEKAVRDVSKTDVRNELRLLQQRIEELGEAVASREISGRFEDLVHLASEVSGKLFYDLSFESGRVRILSGLRELLGYEPGEVNMTREWWLGQVHPDDRSVAEAMPADLLPEKGRCRAIYRMRCKSGRYIIVEESARVGRNSSDPGKSILGCVTDITHHGGNGTQLQEMNGEYETIQKKERHGFPEIKTLDRDRITPQETLQKTLDEIPLMITFYRSGGVYYLNREALNITGISPEEFERTDIMAVWYPDQRYRTEIWGDMMSASPGWKDRKMMAKEGKQILTMWSDTRLPEGSFIGVGMDITERRKAEEELERYNRRLESINRDLQDFATVASHDLQDPLRKIRVFGEMVAAKWNESEDAREYLTRMQNAAVRMQNLLDSLLDYSRLTSEAVSCRELDLGESVREAISNLELHVKETGAKVEVGPLPSVEADGAQITQLFQNLIGNALKFRRMDERPHIRISARSIAEGGVWKRGAYEIRVEDNGIGFEEKHLDRIFFPFQKLHGGDEYQGVGMGLAICKRIIERHGGTITAKSELGKGSTFIVTLPEKKGKT